MADKFSFASHQNKYAYEQLFLGQRVVRGLELIEVKPYRILTGDGGQRHGESIHRKISLAYEPSPNRNVQESSLTKRTWISVMCSRFAWDSHMRRSTTNTRRASSCRAADGAPPLPPIPRSSKGRLQIYEIKFKARMVPSRPKSVCLP